MLDLEPSSLLLLITSVIIAQHIVKFVGKTVIQEFGWVLYCGIASQMGHKKFLELQHKRKELYNTTVERSGVSAQDEYAKWTKLNRRADKLNKEVENLTQEVMTSKEQTTKAVGFALALITTLPVWFFRIWFRKAIFFYFPVGVLPRSLEWILALPFTVTGGISLTLWMMSVNKLMSALAFLLSFPYQKEPPYPKRISSDAEREDADEKIEMEQK